MQINATDRNPMKREGRDLSLYECDTQSAGPMRAKPRYGATAVLPVD